MKEYLKVWFLYTIPWEQLMLTFMQVGFHNLAVENPHIFREGDFKIDIDDAIQNDLSKIRESSNRLQNYIDSSDDNDSKSKLLKEMNDNDCIKLIKDQYNFAKKTSTLPKQEQIAESIKTYFHDFLLLRKQLSEQLADTNQADE